MGTVGGPAPSRGAKPPGEPKAPTMPRGRYSFHDTHDHTPLGEEHFHCATGPSGWRYTAQTTGPAGRPRRLRRPDRRRPRPSDPPGTPRRRLAGPRSGPGRRHLGPHRPHRRARQEGNAAAHAFTGSSPAFLVATARLLRLGPAPPRPASASSPSPPPCSRPAPSTSPGPWSEGQHTPLTTAPCVVDEYQVRALDTGEQHAVHLAGDVVLVGPRASSWRTSNHRPRSSRCATDPPELLISNSPRKLH